MRRWRILLADDHAILRKGLRSLIDAQPDLEVVGEAEDGRVAVQRAKELDPDVVIMDVSMPEVNGIQATERLKQTALKAKVVALTAYDDGIYLRQLLEAGAEGYVLKKTAVEVLIDAIRTVVTGGVYLDPSMAAKVVEGYVGKKRLRGEVQGSHLTDREQEVLVLTSKGYTNKDIAAHLGISVKTVETHKGNSMGKLDLKNRADIVRYALQQGWLQDS